MNNYFKILIPQYNPPKTYLKALDLVGINYVCKTNPADYTEFNGLLIPGGSDVYPLFYNRKLNFSGGNLVKDAFEFSAIDYFYKNNLPILGICRGLQLLNVFFGGTLKNVKFHQGRFKTDIYHDLIPPREGALKNMSGANSNHRQCVDILCKNARSVCFAKDGVIEGFSVGDNILAVQFHPERMGLSAILAIYGVFAKAVERRSNFKI